MRFLAILKQRCPRCLRGRVFVGLLRMNQYCSECGLTFEREPGYFVGAMYVSYSLAIITVVPTWRVMMLMGVSGWGILLAISVQLVLCSPLLFRYSRVIWLHFDQLVHPR